MQDPLPLGIEESTPLAALWDDTLRLLEPRLGRESVESWLRDTAPLSLEDGLLTLGVPNATSRTWIERKYAEPLIDALSELHGAPVRLSVVVHKVSRKPAKAPPPEPSAAASPAPRAPASDFFRSLPLNETYTFDNFVVGQSNRFAQAAAYAVADRPGREFNPLFIYGGVGLGKTHLLQAIGHQILRGEPRARVAYVSGETFTSHFVTSLREHREDEFRRVYRSVDVWLVDDIQFIANKTGTKEEFFHTFNELYLTNRQVVLASDRPPRELHLMEDRIRTRLESGLMVEIAEPELEMRMAILEKRALREHAEVPPEVLYQIARTVTQNIRVLEAALIRMLALASLNRCGITPDLASMALSAFVNDVRVAAIGPLAIQRAVCQHFHISEAELTGPRRDRQTSLARQVAMYLLRELTRKSLVEIGEMFGGKAHSTVVYACSKLEKKMAADARLAKEVQVLRAQLAGAAD
jgi:chromosomal replication initiator protein